MNINRKSFAVFLFALISFIHLQEVTASELRRVLQSGIMRVGDVSLPPNLFTINNNLFNVYYDFVPEGNITMTIKFNAGAQYFGLGLGTTMTGSDIWVFNVVNNKVTANDCYGAGNIPPPQDTSNGGQNNLQVLGYELAPTYTIVKFTRALNTGDPNDQFIQPGLTDFIWATQPGSPIETYHGENRGTLVVNLGNIEIIPPVTESGETESLISEEESSILEEEALTLEAELNEIAENIENELAIESAENLSLL